MSKGESKKKVEGGRSFICIVCKGGSKKHNDVYSLEGKKCCEHDFTSKFIKLITKHFYDRICHSLKSENDKNYVCRSCYVTVLNTHDNIVRLQAGVAQSIKKRLFALQPSSNRELDNSRLEGQADFNQIDIRKKSNVTKTALGKQGIKALKLVCINNRYPNIPLQHVDLDYSHIAKESFAIENGNILKSSGISTFHSGKDASGYRLGLESLLVAVSVVEADNATSSNKTNNALLASDGSEKSKTLDKPGPLSWKQETNRPILPSCYIGERDPMEKISLLLKNDRRAKFNMIYNLEKAGPLSWKRRTERRILPHNINKLDPEKANNLFVKKRVPISLARVKDNNIHMCTQPYCEWIFLSKFSLDNHYKHFHCDGKPHRCPHDGCGKAFAQKVKLKEHMMNHAGIKPFVCVTCGKSFAQSINLKNHMISHISKADLKGHKCPRPGCDRSYKYALSLKRHLLFHDGGDLPFPCTYPLCGKAYKNAYELKCHYRHHTGEKPYKCDEPGCGKSFRLPGQYTIHRRNHKGERPFRCSWEGCEAAYSNRGQLENHSRSHKGKTFICDTCGKTFTYKVTMLVHRKKMHIGVRDFACQVEGCDKAFHFRFELSAHVTKFHNAKHTGKKQKVLRGTKKAFLLYPCPAQGCGKEYVSKPSVKKHLLLVHGLLDVKLEPKTRQDLLVCPVEGCGGQFLTQRNLNYHKVSVHNSLSTQFRKPFGGKRFPCTFEGCQRVYETMTALRQHLARIHISLPTEKMCFNCGSPFRHIQQLEVHRHEMHGADSVFNEQEAGMYTCKAEKCGLQFPNAEDLKQHVRTHMENPPYRCGFAGCRSAFLTEKNYNNHTLSHTKQRPHDCPFQECEERFGTQLQLLKHSIEHYGNYKCPVENCGRMLVCLNSARVHLLRHSGEKPHVCNVCGLAFTVSSNLKRHKMTHTGQKPFECKICLKRFTDKVVLITHIRRHTGEKPYICNVCGSCFSSLASIKVHMRTHTGECPYVCPEEGCGKRFKDLSGLKSHKNVHSKAGQLCSQCGKVLRWGIQRHKCKTVSENVASQGECKKSKHHQQQLLNVESLQEQQHRLQLQHGQELHPFSIPTQQHYQQQDDSQLPQFHQALSLPQVPSNTHHQHHLQQTQLYLTPIVQHQHPNSNSTQHHLPVTFEQQPLPTHQQMQPQTPLELPHSQQTNTNAQTAYILSDAESMQEDHTHGDISFMLDTNTEAARALKSDVAPADSLIMHDLDNNYQIVYEKPDIKQ